MKSFLYKMTTKYCAICGEVLEYYNNPQVDYFDAIKHFISLHNDIDRDLVRRFKRRIGWSGERLSMALPAFRLCVYSAYMSDILLDDAEPITISDDDMRKIVDYVVTSIAAVNHSQRTKPTRVDSRDDSRRESRNTLTYEEYKNLPRRGTEGSEMIGMRKFKKYRARGSDSRNDEAFYNVRD